MVPLTVSATTAVGTANRTIVKQTVDLNGGDLLPGDVVEYTITVTNQGTGAASNVVLLDPIPAGSTYQAGSLAIATGANAGVKTDPAGDDQAEYDGVVNRVVFRLGSGATVVTGGVLNAGESSAGRFRVRINPTTPVGSRLNNQATVTFVNVAPGGSGSAAGATGPAPVVPELPTWLLFGSGLLALGWCRRRRRPAPGGR